MAKQSTAYRFATYRNTMDTTGFSGKNVVLLHTFCSMSIFPFSFPFSGTARVREALRIQFKPLMGEAADNIALIPFFLETDKKNSRGCVYLVYSEETREIETRLHGTDYLLWPEATIFAEKCGGNGLVLLTAPETITTVWFDNWIPAYYSCASAERSDVEREKDAALAYIREQTPNPVDVQVFDRQDFSEAELQALGNAFVAKCPTYARLDLSSKGASMLEKQEQLVSAFSHIGKMLLASGGVLLLLALGVYFQNASLLKQAPLHNETLYTTVFGENSRQPLPSSRAKIQTLHRDTEEPSLRRMLGMLSDSWAELDTSGIVIENLKYGNETTDLTGTSDDNESIQRLRALIEKAGYLSRIENIQRVPSGVLRFTMSIAKGDH